MSSPLDALREYMTQGGASATGVRQQGSTFTREPHRRETVRGQMEDLLASDPEYIRGAERAGERFAAGRGLMNSSMAAQASRNAAIQAGMPIASQDAGMYAQAAGQNMSEMNAQERAKMEMNAAAMASMPVINSHDWVDAEREKDRQHQLTLQEREISLADRARREEQQYGRELTQEERDFMRENRDMGWSRDDRLIGEDRDWQRELIGTEREERQLDRQFERDIFDDQRSDQRDANRQALFSGAFQMMLGTLFSSPDFFRDPQSASGFMEFFTQRFGSLIDSHF